MIDLNIAFQFHYGYLQCILAAISGSLWTAGIMLASDSPDQADEARATALFLGGFISGSLAVLAPRMAGL